MEHSYAQKCEAKRGKNESSKGKIINTFNIHD